MDWSFITKALLAILAVIIASKYVAPLLISLFPPFGVIILIVVYIGIVAFLFGRWPL